MAFHKFIVLFIIFISFQTTLSQEKPFYETYNWEENPNYMEYKNASEGIVGVKHAITTEFFFIDKNSLVEYFLEHKIIWLNSNEKIEDYNKVYIPYSETSEIIKSKARVITPNGDIIHLDKSKFLESQDEETGDNFKFFAFEGIEKGGFIEYFYVKKRYPEYNGKQIRFQTNYPKKNVSFNLYSPKNLVFQFKSYNNFPEIKQDTLTKEKLHWKVETPLIKPLEEEVTSAYQASKQYIIYKLHKNLAYNTTDLSSYGDIAKRLYSFYYPDYSKKTNALLKKFIKEATKNAENEEESKLRHLENYIKTNVYVSNTNNPDLKDLDKILATKVASDTGTLKLYVALIKSLDIKHELLITSDRQKLKFDKNFESHNFLTDFLLYFPKYKTYLAPNHSESRYGFPPAYFTDNYGFFMKEVSVGNFKSGIGKIKYIPGVKAEKTIDKMVINVLFNPEDLTNNTIQLERSLSGYYAMFLQPYIHLTNEKEKKEIIEGFAKNISENIDIQHKNIENTKPEDFGIKPLKVSIEFNSSDFVEKAGNKYLFNVGALIGQQMQLYQEKERVLPVESQYNRSYFRTINITIPKGYKIANLEDINIDNSFAKEGEEYFSFNSYYKLEGNSILITADEHYKKNIVEANLYEEYRKVINSAADFNKITLVLEPTK